MSRRRRRRNERSRYQAPPPQAHLEPRVVVCEASYVNRLAYTRSQAAQALGVSRSTFIRRVLPWVETIEMPWGAKVIPVDELERLLAERRKAAAVVRRPPTRRGRKPSVAPDIVERIVTARAAGSSFSQIAAELNADGAPTAHDAARWWPSTVRGVLLRTLPTT